MEMEIIIFEPLCLIVSDSIVYPDPKSIIKYQKVTVRVNHTIKHNQKTKKMASDFFSEARAWFFDPMLSRKAFATNSLK